MMWKHLSLIVAHVSGRRHLRTRGLCLLLVSLGLSCVGCTPEHLASTVPEQSTVERVATSSDDVDKLLVVDCLLPGRVIHYGGKLVVQAAGQPIKTDAEDCEIRGGTYTAHDRSNYATALKVWSAAAGKGDQAAQTYVGEIYERGLGIPPDYNQAAMWYRKAAEQGYTRAQMHLARLYEKGLGVEHDPVAAVRWYRQATGLSPLIPLGSGESRELQDLRNETARLKRTLDAQQQELELTKQQLWNTQQELAKQGPTNTAQRKMLQEQMQQQEAELNRRRQENIQLHQQISQLKEREADLRGAIVSPPGPVVPVLDVGAYHALVIGNENYAYWMKLQTPKNDINEIADLLSKKYGFRTRKLMDAKRNDIIKTIEVLNKELGEKDSLLIYYAGHGHYKYLYKGAVRGYWIPVDGEKEEENSAQWISAQDIIDKLSIMKARHVLVVADSCFSGAFTRGDIPEEERYALRILAQKRSRTVLSSTDLKPAVDQAGSGGKHSIFAGVLLDVLRTNEETLEGRKLHDLVRNKVVRLAHYVSQEQIPLYAFLVDAGHEGGDFLFVPKP